MKQIPAKSGALERIEQIILANQHYLSDTHCRKELKTQLHPLKILMTHSLNHPTDRSLVFRILSLAQEKGQPADASSWKNSPESLWEIRQFRKALVRNPEFTADYRLVSSPTHPDSYLGRGREGIVYLAQEIASGKLMAIKVKCEREPDIHAYNGAEEVKAVALFKRATGYDFEAKNYTLFNAKSFISGTSLQDLLLTNNLINDSEESKKILSKLKELLQSLIAGGVFFTDVAPENFIFNGEKFYIIDLRPVDDYGDRDITREAYRSKILEGDIAWTNARWFPPNCREEDKARFLQIVKNALNST
ncbi:MAG: hypothetical protein LLG04_16310 [Parachlamydia sp.]|nr:hypothetical protein [Parachlamydia sp.]